MQKPTYTGLNADGIFASPPPTIFAGEVPVVGVASLFELRTIDQVIVRRLNLRHAAVHSGVDALSILGALLTIVHSRHFDQSFILVNLCAALWWNIFPS